jgi:hypothetical protein
VTNINLSFPTFTKRLDAPIAARVNYVRGCSIFPRANFVNGGSGRLASESSFAELLLGALRMTDVPHGFHPALPPRLAQAARGRFGRLDSPLREIRFHGFTFIFSAAASLR